MQAMISWKTRLRSWGYEPIFCSVESKHGLDALAFILRDQTTVIVGPSGVGKSSLINALRNDQLAPRDAEDNWFDSVSFDCFCDSFVFILLVFTGECCYRIFNVFMYFTFYFADLRQ